MEALTVPQNYTIHPSIYFIGLYLIISYNNHHIYSLLLHYGTIRSFIFSYTV